VKGVSKTINSTVSFAIAIFVGIVLLAVLLPLILSQGESGACVGPFKGTASVIADITGVDMC